MQREDWPDVQVEQAYKWLSDAEVERAQRLVTAELDKLSPHRDDLISVNVVIERPQSAQDTGNPYRIRIRAMARMQIDCVVVRDTVDNDPHSPLDFVVHDAFRTLRELLRDELKRRRSANREAAEPLGTDEGIGIVLRLDRANGFGHLKATDGTELYFSAGSVVNLPFDELHPGAMVRYDRSDDDREGPRATTVHVIDARGHDAPDPIEDAAGWERGAGPEGG